MSDEPDAPDPRRRRRALLVAGVAWLAFGIVLLVVVGGATGFIPSDPTVPQVGFVDAGDGTVAVVVGPTSFAQTEAIEIRTTDEARSGRMLWHIRRTGEAAPSGDDADRSTGGDPERIVIGEVPDGFEEVESFDGELPALWHAEVDNRCFYGAGTVPDRLDADAITLESGERVTPDGFASSDSGFSGCDESTVGGRLAAFLGLISVALGAVLILAAWFDWRRGLPKELTGEA